MRGTPVVFLALLVMAGCAANPPGQAVNATSAAPLPPQPAAAAPSGGGISIAGGPDFLCNLIDTRAGALGIGGADLGVPLLNGSSLLLVFGDSFASPASSMDGPSGPAGASSAISSQVPFDCSTFRWLESAQGYYRPLRSSRTPGLDQSTVPAGGIEVNGTAYIYAMRVTHWSKNASDQTHAYGALFREDGGGPFTEMAEWPLDRPFVNAAPVAGSLPDGSGAVFLAVTGLYRKSPVYLAYAPQGDIGNLSAYRYLGGYGSDGSPVWTAEEGRAIPVVDGVWAGEVSLEYDKPLGKYLLMFVDHRNRTLELYYSASPYGPFSRAGVVQPCGSGDARPSWMAPGWGGCYGGYILPDDFGPDGRDVRFTLSLWDPYTTVLMKMRLGDSGSG
jgi:hypothetical protein